MEKSKINYGNSQQFVNQDSNKKQTLELFRFSNAEQSKLYSYNWKLLTEHQRISQQEDQINKEYDFNYDTLVNTLEPHSRELFYWADREYFETTGRHIDINEGTSHEGNALRSARRQAQLWMKWKLFKTPGAAPANLPGCSHHNYGLAVDLKNVDETLKQIMRNNGWSDDIPGEKWHFSCIKSRIYNQVLEKIKELRNGPAGKWALDQQAAYNLSQNQKIQEEELNKKKATFENNVDAFNQSAMIFNNSKLEFIEQTDHINESWANIGSHIDIVDNDVNKLEKIFSELKQVYQEIIFMLESQLSEVRRLLKLPVDELDVIISDRIEPIPGYLKDKHKRLKQEFRTLSASIKGTTESLFSDISSWEVSAVPFQKRAALLLKDYQSLKVLRRNLEKDKYFLETGYTDLALMRREIMFYNQRAGANLEEIEHQINQY